MKIGEQILYFCKTCRDIVDQTTGAANSCTCSKGHSNLIKGGNAIYDLNAQAAMACRVMRQHPELAQ